MNRAELQHKCETCNDWYSNSTVKRLLESQQRIGIDPTVFLSDLEGTLWNPDFPEQTEFLVDVLNSFAIPTCAITGLSMNDYKERLVRYGYPDLDIVISSGGLNIHYLQASHTSDNSGYREDLQYYRDRVARSQWDRLKMCELSVDVIKRISLIHPQAQFDFQNTEAERQFLAGQNIGDLHKYRIGFYFFASSVEERNQVAEEVAATHSFTTVVTEEIHHNEAHPKGPRKFCLDITVMGKDKAAQYVLDKLSVSQGLDAGDGGNDFTHLVNLPPSILSVVVAGAKPELKTNVLQQVERVSGNVYRSGVSGKHFYVDRRNVKGLESIIRAARLAIRTNPQFRGNEYWHLLYSQLGDYPKQR
jgi:hypothetical protein